MTIIINLLPEVERHLLARAQARGVSLQDFAQDVLTREALPLPMDTRTGAALIEAMRACPDPDVDLEPARLLSPEVRDALL